MKTALVRTVILAACVLSSPTVTARSFWSAGLTAGYAGNSTSMTAQYIENYNIHRHDGISAGLYVQYTMKEWFAVRLEPMFIQKGYRTDRKGYIAMQSLDSYMDLSYMYHNVHSNYLQMPVMARFQTPVLDLPVRIYCECGYYAGWWVSSRQEGVIYNSSIDFITAGNTPEEYARYHYDEKAPFVSERDRRLELGYVLGAGVEWDMSEHLSIGLGWREYRAVTSYSKIYDSTGQPYYNSTQSLNLSFGLNF